MVRSRREWTPGTYVRAVGNMKSNQGSDTKALTAFHLRKVKDFNEVTYHLLDCCHAHLYNTKGALPDAKPMAPSNSSFASPQVRASSGPSFGLTALPFFMTLLALYPGNVRFHGDRTCPSWR